VNQHPCWYHGENLTMGRLNLGLGVQIWHCHGQYLKLTNDLVFTKSFNHIEYLESRKLTNFFFNLYLLHKFHKLLFLLPNFYGFWKIK
jgi:hypothetical protein